MPDWLPVLANQCCQQRQMLRQPGNGSLRGGSGFATEHEDGTPQPQWVGALMRDSRRCPRQAPRSLRSAPPATDLRPSQKLAAAALSLHCSPPPYLVHQRPLLRPATIPPPLLRRLRRAVVRWGRLRKLAGGQSPTAPAAEQAPVRSCPAAPARAPSLVSGRIETCSQSWLYPGTET